ncbi:hypothetical protein D3C80_1924320 [compost metagenome]
MIQGIEMLRPIINRIRCQHDIMLIKVNIKILQKVIGLTIISYIACCFPIAEYIVRIPKQVLTHKDAQIFINRELLREARDFIHAPLQYFLALLKHG